MDKAITNLDPAPAPRTSHAEHARRLMRLGWWIILGALVPLGGPTGFFRDKAEFFTQAAPRAAVESSLKALTSRGSVP